MDLPLAGSCSEENPDKNLVHEQSVRDRYGAGAQAAEAALCCPVTYDPQYLKILPEEILERDYGCSIKPRNAVTNISRPIITTTIQ